MSATFATIQALLASPEVTAIVGQRIAPIAGGTTWPDIIVYEVTDESYEGVSGTTDLSQARVTIEMRARSATQVENLRTAVKKALRNRRGTFAGLSCVFLKGVSDVGDTNDDMSIFRRMSDWYVTYS